MKSDSFVQRVGRDQRGTPFPFFLLHPLMVNLLLMVFSRPIASSVIISLLKGDFTSRIKRQQFSALLTEHDPFFVSGEKTTVAVAVLLSNEFVITLSVSRFALIQVGILYGGKLRSGRASESGKIVFFSGLFFLLSDLKTRGKKLQRCCLRLICGRQHQQRS